MNEKEKEKNIESEELICANCGHVIEANEVTINDKKYYKYMHKYNKLSIQCTVTLKLNFRPDNDQSIASFDTAIRQCGCIYPEPKEVW